MSENLGASTSRNPKGLHGLYRPTLPFTFYCLLVDSAVSALYSVESYGHRRMVNWNGFGEKQSLRNGGSVQALPWGAEGSEGNPVSRWTLIRPRLEPSMRVIRT
jgi:hypothetical protein